MCFATFIDYRVPGNCCDTRGWGKHRECSYNQANLAIILLRVFADKALRRVEKAQQPHITDAWPGAGPHRLSNALKVYLCSKYKIYIWENLGKCQLPSRLHAFFMRNNNSQILQSGDVLKHGESVKMVCIRGFQIQGNDLLECFQVYPIFLQLIFYHNDLGSYFAPIWTLCAQ